MNVEIIRGVTMAPKMREKKEQQRVLQAPISNLEAEASAQHTDGKKTSDVRLSICTPLNNDLIWLTLFPKKITYPLQSSVVAVSM